MKASPLTSLLTIADEILTAAELIRDQRLAALSPDMPMATGRAELEAKGFDVAPLTHIPITHYVHLDDLGEGSERPLRELAREIGDDERTPSSYRSPRLSRPCSSVPSSLSTTAITSRESLPAPTSGAPRSGSSPSG